MCKQEIIKCCTRSLSVENQNKPKNKHENLCLKSWN